ncbi:MAG: hypothetical protein ACPKMZ_08775 [Pleomorphochaeta sp.]
MKKKLITILAMLAIGATFIMAATEVANPLTTAYTEDAGSVSTTGESTTVVADAATIPFTLQLEAQDSSGWVPAASKKVYDVAWNVREDFTAPFRVHLTAGTKESVQGLKVTVSATALTRLVSNVASGYVSKGARTIVNPDVGENLDTLVSTDNPEFTFNTKSNHMYGLTDNEADDSFTFGVKYAKDENAPAGRYESTVTVAYSVQS